MDPIFDQARALLNTNQGLVLGDIHGREAINTWIANSLPEFKSENVRVLFLELMFVVDQPTIDGFMRHEPLAEQRMDTFFANFYSPTWGPSAYNILKAARDQGIEIVALEEGTKEASGEDRLRESNPQWEKRISERISRLEPNQKYLVMAGAAHTQLRDGVPGIDARLNIPSIDLIDVEWLPKATELYPTVPIQTTAIDKPQVFAGDGITNNFSGLLPTSPEQRLRDSVTAPLPLAAIAARAPNLVKPIIEISQFESMKEKFSSAELQALRALKLDVIYSVQHPGHPVSPESLGSLESIVRMDPAKAASMRAAIQAIP